MADGKTVKVIVEVVAVPNAAQKVKKPLQDVEKEAKASNSRIAAESKKTDKLIEQSKRDLARALSNIDKSIEKSQTNAAKETANKYIKSVREMEKAARDSANKTRSIFTQAFGGSFLGSIAGQIGGKLLGSIQNAFSSLPNFISDAFNKSAQFSQASLSLAQFSGSAQTATDKIKELIKVSAETPGLSFTSAVEGQKRLQGIGFEAETATKLLKGLATVRVLSGSTKEDMDAMLVNLVQIASGGQRVTQEIREMATRMPALVAIIKKEFGSIGSELNKINPKEFVARLASAMQATRAEFASSTLAVENFKDATDRLYVAIGSIIEQNPEVIALFELMTNNIDRTTEALMDNENQTRSTFTNFVSWTAKAGVSMGNFGNLTYAVLADVATGAGLLVTNFANTTEFIFGAVKNFISQTVRGIGAAVNSVVDIINGLLGGLSGVTGILGLPLPAAIPRVGDVATGFTDGVLGGVSSFDDLRKQFTANWDAQQKFFNTQKGWFQRSRQAIVDNADRWTEFDFLTNQARQRLERQKNQTYPQSVLDSAQTNSGGGGRRRRERQTQSETFGSLNELRSSSGKPVIDALIVKAAREYGIDPNILFFLLKQESRFRSSAVSPKGALGIAQWMPDTAQRFGVNPRDDASAIRGTARVLAQLIPQFGGGEIGTARALAGYNAGWEGRGKFSSITARLDYFMRNVAETSKYVRTILGNYRGVLGKKGAENLSFGQYNEDADSAIQNLNELARVKEKIIELTKELGLAESDYYADTQENAAAVLSRLETLKDLTGDWQKQSEDANKQLFEIRNSGLTASDKVEQLFTMLSEQAGLSAKEIEFLRGKLEGLKRTLDDLNAAQSTRPRIIPWQALPGNELMADDQALLQSQFPQTRTRDDRGNIRRFNELRDSLREQVDYLQRGRREMSEYERTVRQLADGFEYLTDAQREEILATAAQVDAWQKFTDTQEKVRGFFENLFDNALSGNWKSMLSDMLDELKRFIVKAAAQFATLKLFGNSPSGGGLLGGLLNTINGGGLSGLGGGSNSGGGLLGNLFGGNSGVAGLATRPRVVGAVGGLLGLGSHAAASAAPAIGSAVISGGAGAAGVAGGAAATGGLGSLGSLGGLLTNPWTLAAVGAAVGGFMLWKMFQPSAEKKLKKAAESAYSPLKIKDKSILKQLKAIGEASFGKGQAGKRAAEVVQLEQSKDLLTNYAEQTGQSVDKLTEDKFFDSENPKNIYTGFNTPSASETAKSFFSSTSSAGSATSAKSPDNSLAKMILESNAYLIQAITEFSQKFSAANPNDVLMATDSAILADKTLNAFENNANYSDRLKRNTGF